MNEDVLDYLFKWAQDTGYKYSREDFVKLIQSNDKVLNRAFEFAQSSKKPYKKDINSFALLVGRTKPQGTQPEPVATEQTAKAEPTTTEPAKVEPTKVEPQATETVIAKAEDPVKEQVVEEKPAIQVKEVEAPKEEVVKKEMPIGDNLMPVTEKTEVKAVEPTSDKMVVKSKKKEKVKEQPKTEGKPQVEVKDITKEEPKNLKVKLRDIETVPFEPSKKYKPYGEKGPDVYYYEDYDQYVIKEGDKNIIAKKGSDKYNELDSKIGESVKGTKYGKGECPEYQGGCPKNIDEVREYFQKKGRGSYETIIVDKEANLVEEIDGFLTQLNPETKKIERLEYPSSMIESYESGEYKRIGKTRRYVAEEPPKSERFSIYKPFGENGRSFIYDNNTEVIMQETDDKIMSKDGKPMTTWIDIPMPEPEYKEAKALIEGLKFQKEKGSKNTFVPLQTTPGMPEWSPIPNKK